MNKNYAFVFFCAFFALNFVTTKTAFAATEISTCLQLQAIDNDRAEDYLLVNDIDCSGSLSWNAGAGFNPIGDEGNPFTGTLNGQGYKVESLFINRPTTDYVGLIAYTAGGDTLISNIGLTDMNITGRVVVGGIASDNNGATFSHVYSTGSISGTFYVGGILGSHAEDGALIEDSYSTANVTASGGDAGGLIGFAYHTATVTNCFANGVVNSSGGAEGGLIGELEAGSTVTNSFYDSTTSGLSDSDRGTPKTTTQMKTQSTFTGWDFTVAGNGTIGDWVMAGYPHLQMETRTTITTPVELQLMVVDLTDNYTLASDLDASETSSWNGGDGFVPVGDVAGYYEGNFDGAGYEISDLFIDDSDGLTSGLFGWLDGVGNISNLGLVDVNVTGGGYTGGIVGISEGTIINVYVIGDSEINGDEYTGGVMGYNNGGGATISHSYADATVVGDEYVGGFSGLQFGGTISDCYSLSTVSGDRVGGFLGLIMGGTTDNVYATGSLTGSVSEGGIIGATIGGTISDSYYDSTTTGASDVGNGTGKTTAQMKTQSTFDGWDFSFVGDGTIGDWIMAGYPHLQLEHREAITTPVEFQLMFIDLDGDYVLQNDLDFTEITNYTPIGLGGSEFTGTFDGQGYLISDLTINQPNLTSVGIFGATNADATITELGYLNGSVTGDRFVGGIVGYNAGTITKSFSKASITADTVLASNGEAGGLVGVNTADGSISDSYSTGVVTSTFDVGGLIGYNAGTVTRAYATGIAYGGDNNGGLIGRAEISAITNSFATTDAQTGDSVGGLVGALAGGASISGSYWNDAGDDLDCYQGGNSGCNSVDDDVTYFYDIENEPMGNWDFDVVWIDGLSNYPTLAAFGDITPPNVEITALDLLTTDEGANYSNVSPIIYVVTFTEDVTSFDDLEELIVTNGEAQEITPISDSVYQVSVLPDEQDDDGGMPVSLGFNEGVASDDSGNLSNVDSPFVVIYDGIDPNGEFISPTVTNGGETSTTLLPFAVTFNEDAAEGTFTVDDITLVNARIYNFDVATINTQFSFNIVPSNPGLVSVSVDQSKFTDIVGNENSNISAYSFTYTPANPSGGGSANVSVGGRANGGGGSGSEPESSSGDDEPSPDTSSQSDVVSTDFPFKDLQDHFAMDAVKKLYELNVIQGRSATEYEPQEFLTRAEMAKIAVLIFGIPLETDVEAVKQYSDLEPEEWYVPYIVTGTKNGFLKGYDDGTFRPNQSMTRAEALKVLVMASGATLDGEFESPFDDVASDDWFAKIVNYAYEKGIVKGRSPETFAPEDLVTRGEMAVMTVNTYDLSR